MKLPDTRLYEIEAMADDVLADVFGAVDKAIPPINLDKIMEKYGLSLSVVEFKDPGIIGAYDKKTQAILVKKDERYQKTAFTIAHEIGHFVMHRDHESELLYRSQVTKLEDGLKLIESEANWFAACLLMPRLLFSIAARRLSKRMLLAELFHVSETAVHWRLKNLNIQ